MTEGWWSGDRKSYLGPQKPNLLFIALAKIPELEGSISPSSFYDFGVDKGDEEGR